MNLLFKEESYKIIGACFEVYNELRDGFDEAVYHEALLLEMEMQGIPFVDEPVLEVFYKGKRLKKRFNADMVCYSKIVFEMKAVSALNDFHRRQVKNYLKATSFELGLLVNFGSPGGLEYERVLRNEEKD